MNFTEINDEKIKTKNEINRVVDIRMSNKIYHQTYGQIFSQVHMQVNWPYWYQLYMMFR